jgi:predicted ABC-type ATPase
MAKSLVVISGSMGSGKTSVLGEASDVLTANGIVHAAIDLDALGTAHLPRGAADHIRCRNLAAICRNYAAEGVAKFLLAGAIEDAQELDRIRLAAEAGTVVVIRLTAHRETMQERIRTRETGMLQSLFVARVAELEAILDRAHLESVTICNDGRTITAVARELLVAAGWF